MLNIWFFKVHVIKSQKYKKTIFFSETYETIALFGSGATTSTEEVAALARFGSETAALVTLGTAVDLGKLLAVFGSFAPTTGGARFVTFGTFALRFGEVVDVDVLGIDTGDDFIPVDGLHVTQVVVVEQTATTRQNICNTTTALLTIQSVVFCWFKSGIFLKNLLDCNW